MLFFFSNDAFLMGGGLVFLQLAQFVRHQVIHREGEGEGEERQG